MKVHHILLGKREIKEDREWVNYFCTNFNFNLFFNRILHDFLHYFMLQIMQSGSACSQFPDASWLVLTSDLFFSYFRGDSYFNGSNSHVGRKILPTMNS
jgi:hypothetical protein